MLAHIRHSQVKVVPEPARRDAGGQSRANAESAGNHKSVPDMATWQLEVGVSVDGQRWAEVARQRESERLLAEVSERTEDGRNRSRGR